MDMRPESIYGPGVAAKSGRHAHVDNHTRPSISVRKYLGSIHSESDRNYLDARRFAGMRVNGLRPSVIDALGISRLTGVGGWVAR